MHSSRPPLRENCRVRCACGYGLLCRHYRTRTLRHFDIALLPYEPLAQGAVLSTTGGVRYATSSGAITAGPGPTCCTCGSTARGARGLRLGALSWQPSACGARRTGSATRQAARERVTTMSSYPECIPDPAQKACGSGTKLALMHVVSFREIGHNFKFHRGTCPTRRPFWPLLSMHSG